jgi:hypothetical protein
MIAAVIFRRGIEVVVVVVEAGRLETARLALREHAERGAGLQPDRFDACDHRALGQFESVPEDRLDERARLA